MTNLTGVNGGLFNVGDQDDPNAPPVQIRIGLVAIPGPIPSGPFASVEMDCLQGQPAPTAGNFTCSVTGATLLGGDVDVSCDLTVDVAAN